MGIENDPGFWIPPGSEKQDRPEVGIPVYVPLPDTTPPPEFDPTKERPDMEDHPREDHDSDKQDEPEKRHIPDKEDKRVVIIGEDGEEEDDDRIKNPFKDEDEM